MPKTVNKNQSGKSTFFNLRCFARAQLVIIEVATTRKT